MTSARQFIACKFREGDARSYTYHNDGEPLTPGDHVRVADRRGDGWQKVVVAEIVAEPAFPTKPILGRHEEPPAAAAAADELPFARCVAVDDDDFFETFSL